MHVYETLSHDDTFGSRPHEIVKLSTSAGRITCVIKAEVTARLASVFYRSPS